MILALQGLESASAVSCVCMFSLMRYLFFEIRCQLSSFNQSCCLTKLCANVSWLSMQRLCWHTLCLMLMCRMHSSCAARQHGVCKLSDKCSQPSQDSITGHQNTVGLLQATPQLQRLRSLVLRPMICPHPPLAPARPRLRTNFPLLLLGKPAQTATIT